MNPTTDNRLSDPTPALADPVPTDADANADTDAAGDDASPRRALRRVIAIVIVAGLVGLAAAGIDRLHAESPVTASPVQPPAMPVSVASALAADVASADEFSGRLEAVERVEIRPRVAGTIKAVHFREGALVGKGDLLYTIDPEPFAAEVERAEARVAAAAARAAFSRSENDRAQRLLADRAVARREADERANAQGEADANLRGARAELQAARLNLGYTRIVAPVAGRVGRLAVTVGNLVGSGPGAPVLTTLVSTSPIYASFDADERVVGRTLRELRGENGRTASVADLGRVRVAMGTVADGDLPHEGRLQLVDNQVDARSGTVRVRAVFANADGSLMPGQFARIRMQGSRTEPVVLVSERAIGTDQSRKFVMVIGADDTASYREVTLGAHVDGLRVVTAGLKPDERVVVNGLHRVRSGARVVPQVVSMTVAASGAGTVASRASN